MQTFPALLDSPSADRRSRDREWSMTDRLGIGIVGAGVVLPDQPAIAREESS
jgi:hypothetical protein